MTALQLPLFLALLASSPPPDVPSPARAPAAHTVTVLERVATRTTLTLELPDGRTSVAHRTHLAHTRPGGFTWLGTLSSDPAGHVALAVQDDALVGTVLERGVLFRVRLEHGRLLLQQRASEGTHGCSTAEVPGLAPLTPILSPSPAGSTSLPAALGPRGARGGYAKRTADLMIVWTQEAEDAVGGDTAVQALADLAVAETNMILRNSLVAMDVRLVHSGLVSYAEASDLAVDLDRLQKTGDGFLDEVHTLRDQVGADLVSLFVADDSSCGRSFIMSPASAAFAPWAFTVISQGCATGEYALAHELGHNFGLDHDRINAYAPPSHVFAHGFWLANGVFRTVMALPRWGVTGVRIPYYSNPDRLYLGQHFLGVPHPSAYSSNCSHAIDLNAGFIVNWRPTQVP